MEPAAQLQFSPESLTALNLSLAFIMFAVSLFIELKDFGVLRRRPRGFVAGLTMQWLALPLLAIALAYVLQPGPGLALGMLLVAACPGGNVSNFLNLVARANVALSIGLTALSTLLAPLMTPLLFYVGSQLLPGTAASPLLQVSFGEMMQSVFVLMAIPLTLGQALRRLAPRVADAIRKPVRTAAGLVLLAVIVSAFVKNADVFRSSVAQVGWLIVLHNALTLVIAYAVAMLYRVPEADRRAVTLESGIHNAGLGLVLIFNFFGGSGPMALMVAGWGVWHLVTGGGLALWWSRRPPAPASASAPEPA